ncbi:hypothetical protein K470DRAFT_289578 [Piedraia hortae CBS 480.64]|uniref:Uncharacterized protein n=1 Tax=Piedraia hortae CBS 480.64 TaxID=1314780 RepID=A0A6A7BT34_9PEZI|nr:hypothetical protein K470DRAFT_289578 [Piedraia hortae CBS 480.64]
MERPNNNRRDTQKKGKSNRPETTYQSSEENENKSNNTTLRETVSTGKSHYRVFDEDEVDYGNPLPPYITRQIGEHGKEESKEFMNTPSSNSPNSTPQIANPANEGSKGSREMLSSSNMGKKSRSAPSKVLKSGPLVAGQRRKQKQRVKNEHTPKSSEAPGRSFPSLSVIPTFDKLQQWKHDPPELHEIPDKLRAAMLSDISEDVRELLANSGSPSCEAAKQEARRFVFRRRYVGCLEHLGCTLGQISGEHQDVKRMLKKIEKWFMNARTREEFLSQGVNGLLRSVNDLIAMEIYCREIMAITQDVLRKSIEQDAFKAELMALVPDFLRRCTEKDCLGGQGTNLEMDRFIKVADERVARWHVLKNRLISLIQRLGEEVNSLSEVQKKCLLRRKELCTPQTLSITLFNKKDVFETDELSDEYEDLNSERIEAADIGGPSGTKTYESEGEERSSSVTCTTNSTSPLGKPSDNQQIQISDHGATGSTENYKDKGKAVYLSVGSLAEEARPHVHSLRNRGATTLTNGSAPGRGDLSPAVRRRRRREMKDAPLQPNMAPKPFESNTNGMERKSAINAGAMPSHSLRVVDKPEVNNITDATNKSKANGALAANDKPKTNGIPLTNGKSKALGNKTSQVNAAPTASSESEVIEVASVRSKSQGSRPGVNGTPTANGNSEADGTHNKLEGNDAPAENDEVEAKYNSDIDTNRDTDG